MKHNQVVVSKQTTKMKLFDSLGPTHSRPHSGYLLFWNEKQYPLDAIKFLANH